MSNKDSILVSTGRSKLHLYNAASAAQGASFLNLMVTSLYLKKRWIPIINILEKNTKRKFFKRLLLCRDNQISDEKVISFPSITIVSKLRNTISQRGVNDNIRFWLERVESIYYGKRIKNYISPGVKLIHSRSGYSRGIFPYARKKGIKVLLEQSASHPDYVKKIMDEEYEKWNVHMKNRAYVAPREEMKWDISQAEYIVTNSDYVAHTIKENIAEQKKNIYVVHTGLDVNTFRPNEKPKKGKFKVLYVGNLSTFKGIGYLITAFMKLHLPDAELLLVGKKHEDCPNIVDDYIDKITYIPAVPYSEVPGIFAGADVFVFPSLVEGPSRVVGEALATGLPCIVTSGIANCGHIVDDGINGFVVSSKNSEILAEKILYLYQNRDVCLQMGYMAREKAVNCLTWSHYQQNLLRVYKQILNDEK